MELEAVRLGVTPLYRMIAGHKDQDVDGFGVVDAETDRHLTFSLEEREARILAEAERALVALREIVETYEAVIAEEDREEAERILEAAFSPKCMVVYPMNPDGEII